MSTMLRHCCAVLTLDVDPYNSIEDPNRSACTGVLVVTGGSRGIGVEIRRLAAAKGWTICVNHSNSRDEADHVANAINQAGGGYVGRQRSHNVRTGGQGTQHCHGSGQ
ncbi:MAG: hypothetical protein OEQ39_14750 [Gammaproteobacteria bacterium]|nr:hypothetical protein [Gammaproteobacteria bacterium]MDH3468296.1 hypothetical protein [Gammaproteobacteria bacterium]